MNFTVYRSSAGSGKTFTLVKEYLKIALAGENESPLKFRKILAITFTNKAAQEMKDRVIRALKELSAPNSGEPSALAQILISELQLDTLKLQQRAENLLRAILHNYSDFAIGTIDSFTHRIVRSFAYDLGLPMNFEVALEKDEMLQKAVDKLLSKIGLDKDITDTLLKFSEEKTDDEKGWQIENELKATAEYLLKESGALNADRLRELTLSDFSEIRSKFYQLTKSFEDKIIFQSQKAVDLIRSAGLSAEDFYQSRSGICVWFQNINKGEFKSLATPNSYVLKSINEDKWTSGTAAKSGTAAAVMETAPRLREIFLEIQETVKADYPVYITRSAIRNHLYSLAVLNELEKILKEFRADENIVHISEFNHIISKVVAEQPVPYIFEKLGARYSHFLIDEFQDTSVLQWENLLPLMENGLAENNFSMVVGDAKQAIYRWRSGDVEQFVMLPSLLNKDNELMEDRERSLKRHFLEQELDRNFRSKKNIVEFNNDLFFSLSSLLSSKYKIIYERVAQKVKPGNDGGFVELRFPVREGNIDAVYTQYTEEAIATIRQLLVEGWKMRDIALLVRENRQGSLLANALINEGIPVLSSDSLLIRNSPLICCVVSLLRTLEHPEDRIALTDAADYLNKTGRGYFPLHDIQKQRAALQQVLSVFNITENLNYLSVLPLYQQCETLIRTVFPEEQKNAWVVFFLDELLRFGVSRNPDRESFFAWWEDRSRNASVVIPDGTDAINIMTIHKSKGLEFPVVIIPYLDWKQKSRAGGDTIWVEPADEEVPQLEVALVSENKLLKESSVAEQYLREIDKKVLDQMNLLYVGCTRAVDQLYVISQRVEKSEDPTSVPKWLNDIYSEQLANGDVIQFGENTGPVHSDKPSTNAEFISLSAGEGKWTGKLRMRKYSEEAWGQEQSSRETGILLHNLLEKINSQSDVQPVVESAVNSGFIPGESRDEITRMLHNVTNHELLTPYFSGDQKGFIETDILNPGERASRPDRVVVVNGEAVVLEYKTGAESDDHVQQVKHYKSLLERMGHQKVKGILIYLEPLRIHQV